MIRDELEELHFITPIANLQSILERGILSHNKAQAIPHESVALQEVQDLRSKKRVPPNNRRLHDFANLYIHARNPMMYRRHDEHKSLCVLKIDTTVLDVPGVIITDGNASSSFVRFAPSPKGLEIVESELAFAIYWTDSDPIQKYRKTFARCAEVLVPDLVSPEFIVGAYVSCDEARVSLGNTIMNPLVIEQNQFLFFA